MAAVVITGDTSGSVTLQAPAVAGTTTLTLPSTSGTVLTTASTTGISGSAISSGTVAEAYGGTGTSTGYYGFKNRIINGAMMIDQRGTASTPVTTSGLYVTDRFAMAFGNASCSFQQVTDAPSGFINSLKLTVTTGSAPSAGTNNVMLQKIEGLNVADLAFGSAAASTITLSFWVKGSVTGTYAVSFTNSAFSRSYVATYTINSANTWEQKTVTVAGDTTGTWLTTNGIGLTVLWDFGSGTNLNTTAGSWQAGNYYRTSACTTIASTTNATLQITGVQLEKGSTATSFDYRPYGTELMLCQRYYQTSYTRNRATSVAGSMEWTYSYAVVKRAAPTVSVVSSGSGTVTVANNSNTDAVTFSDSASSSGNVVFTSSAEL